MTSTGPSPTPDPTSPSPPNGREDKRIGRLVLVPFLILGAITVLILYPEANWLEELLRGVRKIGVWGPLLIIAAYVATCVFMVPGTLLSLGAGWIYGLFRGTLTIWAGATIGAGVAFLLGRTVLSDWVEEKVGSYPNLSALDDAVARHGFKVVLLTRLPPFFPFFVLNYIYSLTRVRFRDFLLGSVLGMLPSTILFVYFGSAARDWQEVLQIVSGEANPANTVKRIALVVGIVVTLVVLAILARAAKQALAHPARRRGPAGDQERQVTRPTPRASPGDRGPSGGLA